MNTEELIFALNDVRDWEVADFNAGEYKFVSLEIMISNSGAGSRFKGRTVEDYNDFAEEIIENGGIFCDLCDFGTLIDGLDYNNKFLKDLI